MATPMQQQQPAEAGPFKVRRARQPKNAPHPQDVPMSSLASPYGSDFIHVALPAGKLGGYCQTSLLPQKQISQPVSLKSYQSETTMPSSEATESDEGVSMSSTVQHQDGVKAFCESESNLLPTTLMIRNIPQLYTRDELVIQWPNDGSYDFFYLPYKTYAFINFTSSIAAEAFKERWNKTWLPRFASRRPLNISCAQVQGMRANLLQLKKNRPWRLKLDEYQPLIFVYGAQITTEEALAQLHE